MESVYVKTLLFTTRTCRLGYMSTCKTLLSRVSYIYFYCSLFFDQCGNWWLCALHGISAHLSSLQHALDSEYSFCGRCAMLFAQYKLVCLLYLSLKTDYLFYLFFPPSFSLLFLLQTSKLRGRKTFATCWTGRNHGIYSLPRPFCPSIHHPNTYPPHLLTCAIVRPRCFSINLSPQCLFLRTPSHMTS